MGDDSLRLSVEGPLAAGSGGLGTGGLILRIQVIFLELEIPA